jgi:REP element-mobilizing transposase RayT
MDSDRIFFVTTVTAQRHPIFRQETTADLLIEILAHHRDERKFLLHEFVIMPDHVHALLTSAPEISLERAMQFIKGGFSYRLMGRSLAQGRVRHCGTGCPRLRGFRRMGTDTAGTKGRAPNHFKEDILN